MKPNWMQDALNRIMAEWAEEQGCSKQSALRDLLTDLRHIAEDDEEPLTGQRVLFFDVAVADSGDVFMEELAEGD